jgi:hypothetical protein
MVVVRMMADRALTHGEKLVSTGLIGQYEKLNGLGLATMTRGYADAADDPDETDRSSTGMPPGATSRDFFL